MVYNTAFGLCESTVSQSIPSVNPPPPPPRHEGFAHTNCPGGARFEEAGKLQKFYIMGLIRTVSIQSLKRGPVDTVASTTKTFMHLCLF